MRTWSERCLAAIEKERKEVESRYGIRLGRTEIFCATCGRPWVFGTHECPKNQAFRHLKGHLKGVTGSRKKAGEKSPASFSAPEKKAFKNGLRMRYRGIS